MNNPPTSGEPPFEGVMHLDAVELVLYTTWGPVDTTSYVPKITSSKITSGARQSI